MFVSLTRYPFDMASLSRSTRIALLAAGLCAACTSQDAVGGDTSATSTGDGMPVEGSQGDGASSGSSATDKTTRADEAGSSASANRGHAGAGDQRASSTAGAGASTGTNSAGAGESASDQGAAGSSAAGAASAGSGVAGQTGSAGADLDDADAGVEQAGASGMMATGGPGSAGAPAAGAGSQSTAIDYSQRGPFEVVTEKNLGESFRNRNVTDDSIFCRAFVGSIMLPNEGDVDEQLTNYPQDMDRQLYTMFRPKTLEDGKKYPVITWGNGTCAHPLLYSPILEHLASHGFIIIATNSTSVGSGTEMQRALDFVLAENERADSVLFEKIDPALLGAAGHSQGSMATVTVGGNARIKVTVPIEGAMADAVQALKGPVFLISGEEDTLVDPAGVETAFEAATVPAVYGMSMGQDHLMPGRMPEPILKGVTAWFAIHLQGEDAARPIFYGDKCELCTDPSWTLKRKNL